MKIRQSVAQSIVTVVAMAWVAVAQASEYTTAKALLLKATDAPDGRANASSNHAIISEGPKLSEEVRAIIEAITSLPVCIKPHAPLLDAVAYDGRCARSHGIRCGLPRSGGVLGSTHSG